MEHFVNENIVMQFYLEEMGKDSIVFLKGKEEAKKRIKNSIEALMAEEKMNYKIQIACNLWKQLFEAAMSYISPEKEGYDKLFKYFDAYVEFEELIFASDSFYRDHTLHCIWVYFLGEYIHRKEEFQELFVESESQLHIMDAMMEVSKRLEDVDTDMLEHSLDVMKKVLKNDEAARCVAALTHDLGYPLKKIEKINKGIKKVLPYFAINNFEDFNFEYENVQQEFISQFIDFISREYQLNFVVDEKSADVFNKLFKIDEFGGVRGVDREKVKQLTEEECKVIAETYKFEANFDVSVSSRFTFFSDFEEYRHGIMSAFLLCKNLRAFQHIEYDMKAGKLIKSRIIPDERILTLNLILATITAHTNDAFKISSVEIGSFLTFVDELEEFSRISRASQNREYVEEFCDTALYMKDGWLNIDFEFNNENLDNLDPEISFKGRCKRFLSLFDIRNLSPYLKIRVSCIGKLPTDQNTYVLEIANRHADIRINGESMNIPKYLKTNQFYTKEEYAEL